MKIKIIAFIIIIAVSGLFATYANDTSKIGGKSVVDISARIDQYMKRVFGENAPTIDDYFKFEGIHNIGEYNEEISACKIRYGNPQNLTNKQYIETIPTKCRDWISDRHDNPEKYSSLYYEANRKKFHKYPLKYKIKSIEDKGNYYLVSIMLPEEKAEIKLNIYYSIPDPEFMTIEINNIVQQ